MPRAFVMVNVKVGTDREVLGQLESLEHVVKVYDVYGVYDLVAEIEADTMEELRTTLNSKIRRLDKVQSTHTMIVVE